MWATYFYYFINLSRVNCHQLGKNLPHLVTLLENKGA
jgi:hypothetical protein